MAGPATLVRGWVCGEPGSPEFVRSSYEAHESLRAPDASRFRSLVVSYKASDDFKKLAP